MLETITIPTWLLVVVYPVLAFILLAVWLLTRGSTSEFSLKGFGVEMTLREQRHSAAEIMVDPGSSTVITVAPQQHVEANPAETVKQTERI